jgi:hypothetical protein
MRGRVCAVLMVRLSKKRAKMPPRKKPFSGKQKKVQLQERKAKKRNQAEKEAEEWKQSRLEAHEFENEEQKAERVAREAETERQKRNFKMRRTVSNRGKLVTILELESNEEIQRRKKDAQRPLDLAMRDRVSTTHAHTRLHCTTERENAFVRVLRSQPWDFLKENVNLAKIDMPKRPQWDHMTENQVKAAEEKYFEQWIDSVIEQFRDRDLNYFECNLEVCARERSAAMEVAIARARARSDAL